MECPVSDERSEMVRRLQSGYQTGYEDGFERGRLDYQGMLEEFESVQRSSSDLLWLVIGTIGILSGILIVGIGIGLAIR